MESQIHREFDPEDVEKNKVMAILAYIIFLFPLLAAKESEFAVYHTNQGIVLFLTAVVIVIFGSIIPIIGWFVLCIGNLYVLAMAILGIVNAANGEAKPLPVIGGINILKGSDG